MTHSKDARPLAGTNLADGRKKVIDLSPAMQLHIAAAAIRDPAVMSRIRPVLNADYFEDDAVSEAIAWACHHWDEHRQLPSKAAFHDALPDRELFVKKLFREEIPDVEHTVQRIRDFANVRALSIAILKAAEVLNARKRGDVHRDEKGRPTNLDPVTLVKDAMMVGREADDLGIELHDALEAEIKEILCPQEKQLIGTGIPAFDESGVLLDTGECGLVLAATKVGKSQVLTSIGYHAISAGHDVVYISVEMSKARVLRRFVRRIAGATADDTKDPVHFVKRLRRRVPVLARGRLFVQKFHPYRSTVDDVRAYLTNLATERGVRPKVVIIDYPGILAPRHPTGETRIDLANIWLEVRALADEFQTRVWGAAQANRGSIEKDRVGLGDIGESYAILQHIDVGFSLCRTRDETQRRYMRAFIMASRNEADGMQVGFTYDWRCSLIKDARILAPGEGEEPVDPDAPAGRGPRGARKDPRDARIDAALDDYDRRSKRDARDAKA